MTSAAAQISLEGANRIASAARYTLSEAPELHLRAVILTGSLARNEATWLQSGGTFKIAGDAEFFLVLDEGASIPSDDCLARIKHETESRLGADGIDVSVGLSPIRPSYLKRLLPHIFAYELCDHGRVIWGDARVLSLIPRFSASEIPFEDGFRILLNRLVELLEAICEAGEIEPVTDVVRYRATKLLLDMATSFLVFQHQYESTYRKRAARLVELAERHTIMPIPVVRFAQQVLAATKYKLSESARSPIETPSDLFDLVNDAHSLWTWELRRLTSSHNGETDHELLCRWLREQSYIGKLRGWASIAKRLGLLTTIKSLPRWIKQAQGGSPRRLIYAAASELFFAIPAEYTDGRATGARSPRPRWELPTGNNLAHGQGWQAFGRAIAWNYRHFLESTRS